MDTQKKTLPGDGPAEGFVAFRHTFDRAGTYSHTEPLDYLEPRELVTGMDALTKESAAALGADFVLEVVPMGEVTDADLRTLLGRLRARGELHRSDRVVGAYLRERLAA